MISWPFSDAPDLAVFTSRAILEGQWIHCVSHDADGDWQFQALEGAPDDMAEARMVSLHYFWTRDPSIGELADLPLGWFAWRDDPGAPWKRSSR